MPIRIVVAHPEPESSGHWVAALRTRLPDAEVFAWRPGAAAVADYAVGWQPPGDFFARQPQLRAFFSAAAGVDHLLRHPGLPATLPLIRLEDAGMAAQMAEYCLNEIVGLHRRRDEYAAQQRAASWRELPVEPREAWPIGVFGLGVLGTPVAQAIAAYGFPVRGYSQRGRAIDRVACFDASHGLREFLSGCRVLILMAPLTPATADLFDPERLGWLPAGAWLINVARGGLLVESALLDAIDRGRLAGATLDVFRDEPLPPAHPFWHHPKIRITPHVAAVTRIEESADQVVAKLRAIERGATVGGIVDRRRGY
ncbi:MAG: glyoxylate/hydroxypyruvate reductase A [Burkholderiales bacterium]|nr:MAG: glyoxylate/hydroxypyruvate reductase A [Burkholderiales bacterium]